MVNGDVIFVREKNNLWSYKMCPSQPWLIHTPMFLAFQLKNECFNVIPVWCKSLTAWRC